MSNRPAAASVFAEHVLRIVARIPAGRVATYGEVAARAVGNIMARAKRPGLPYHRVVAAGGRVGGYGSNPQLKAALLRAEGHTVIRGRIRQFPGRRLPAGNARSR